ncbi:unnamed protein product [Ectocarpus sp. 12 AP-2014]
MVSTAHSYFIGVYFFYKTASNHYPATMEGAMALAEQGKRLRKGGKLAEAERVLRRSLRILEAKRGREGCAGMIMPLSELGACLGLVGRPEEMELIARRCLTIQEADLGPRSEHVAETLYLIGHCLLHPNRAEEGENVARRCVEVQEGTVGGNSTRLIPALNLLGIYLTRLGRLDEAEGILRRSLTIGETNRATLDEIQYQQAMAATVHALGVCLLQAGKLEEAEGTLRRGLAIHEMELGPEKLAALTTMDLWTDYGLRQTYPHALHALGTCLLRAGKLEEVEDILRRGLAIHEVDWGHDGVEVSNILVDLASYLRQTGELQEAEELLRRCLSIREAKLGSEDVMVGDVLLELGRCLLEATRAAEGADVLRRCLNIHEAHLGLEHIGIPSVLYPLAGCLARTGKTGEAERMLRRCIRNQEANMGRDHQAVAYTLHLLGVFLRHMGKLEEAQELLGRCMEIFEAKAGPEHLCMMTSTRLELSVCLRHEGELKGWDRSEVSVGNSSTLRMLDDDDWEYETLCDTFTARWIKPQPANGVTIVRIFSIQVPHGVRDMHEHYKRMVVVNLSQRFHGTSCNEGCNFMVDPQGATSPCGLSSCSVCSICMLGFKLGRNVARTALATCIPLRYGTGIYFSSVSGKANDYADLSAKTDKDGTELRCMFVANVAGGKAFNTKNPYLPQSECPPPGYQSVVGEVGEGLNFDEVVVYKEEAALPTHLIVYALRH